MNRLTRDSDEKAFSATLKGWQRSWAHRAARSWHSPVFPDEIPAPAEASSGTSSGTEQKVTRAGVCALTIAPNPAIDIDGVLVEIDSQDIGLLDQREIGYQRLLLPAELFVCSRTIAEDTVIVYRSLPENTGFANLQYPLIQSYVDCVISGYATRFGEQGVQRFMRSTTGWDSPQINDRLKPLYPRAQRISTDVLAYIDELLHSHGGKTRIIDYSG